MGWWTWVLPAAYRMPVPMQAGQCCGEPIAQEKQKKLKIPQIWDFLQNSLSFTSRAQRRRELSYSSLDRGWACQQTYSG